MTQLTGFLDSGGSPRLKIFISGVFSQEPQEFEAIIDTGFSGFISMPFIQAFPLGLPLFGTTGVILADGTRAFKLTAKAKAHVEGVIKIGVVILEPNSSDVLIGIDFLRTFEKVLLLHIQKPLVLLVDCKVVDNILPPELIQGGAPTPAKITNQPDLP